MLGFGLVKNEADIDPAAMQLFKQNGVCTKLNDLARVRGSVSGLDLQRNVRTVFKLQYHERAHPENRGGLPFSVCKTAPM